MPEQIGVKSVSVKTHKKYIQTLLGITEAGLNAPRLITHLPESECHHHDTEHMEHKRVALADLS